MEPEVQGQQKRVEEQTQRQPLGETKKSIFQSGFFYVLKGMRFFMMQKNPFFIHLILSMRFAAFYVQKNCFVNAK